MDPPTEDGHSVESDPTVDKLDVFHNLFADENGECQIYDPDPLFTAYLTYVYIIIFGRWQLSRGSTDIDNPILHQNRYSPGIDAEFILHLPEEAESVISPDRDFRAGLSCERWIATGGLSCVQYIA